MNHQFAIEYRIHHRVRYRIQDHAAEGGPVPACGQEGLRALTGGGCGGAGGRVRRGAAVAAGAADSLQPQLLHRFGLLCELLQLAAVK